MVKDGDPVTLQCSIVGKNIFQNSADLLAGFDNNFNITYKWKCKTKSLIAILGESAFDVVWLHDNKEIKPSEDFQYVNQGEVYKLVIPEIFPEDSGTYTCDAFNDSGEVFSTCTLKVQGMLWYIITIVTSRDNLPPLKYFFYILPVAFLKGFFFFSK